LAYRELDDTQAYQGLAADRLKERLMKTRAKVVSHGRYVAFQMAEVAIAGKPFTDILWLIADLLPPPDPPA
jgi:hypothetical protein